MCWGVTVCIWRPEADIGCLPQSSLPATDGLKSLASALLELDLSFLHSNPVLGSQTYTIMPVIFTRALGIQAQVLCLHCRDLTMWVTSLSSKDSIFIPVGCLCHLLNQPICIFASHPAGKNTLKRTDFDYITHNCWLHGNALQLEMQFAILLYPLMVIKFTLYIL